MITGEEVEELEDLADLWISLNQSRYQLNDRGLKSLAKFYFKYNLSRETLEIAMKSACRAVPIDDIEGRFRYFCSVCWRSIYPEKYNQPANSPVIKEVNDEHQRERL